MKFNLRSTAMQPLSQHLFWLILLVCNAIALNTHAQPNYVSNRAPLQQNAYIELPLGAIEPQGWLKTMLEKQRDGATGRLDSLYPLVMGKRNGWLGGDGDQWERGPYWIDGLLPLAYILKDKKLIEKTKPWIEWTLNSQQADGYFGPAKDYGPEQGIQRDNSHDWWPKMVMLKVLKQYYAATGDKRVIGLMTKYFAYQLRELPKHPLDHWTFWAKYRGGDNLAVVYWLYNITGDKFLLNLADLIHFQTFDYTTAFLSSPMLTANGSIHGVNLAQGMKDPVVYYQQHPDKKYIAATEKGYDDLKKFDGMPFGLFGGDETLHGNNPTQGSELCTAVEMMFTLENTLQITGATRYADHLERIAFNAMPAQVLDNFTDRQYFQQANQVMATRHTRNFDTDHSGTDVCYGVLTGYPCCTSNMHQGWPKFTQNLWYATPDSGLAAMVYSASKVSAMVASKIPVSFIEQTNYPFDETIRFTFSNDKKNQSVSFPLILRIPSWCNSATVLINGKQWKAEAANNTIRIVREWKTGDIVELTLPMHVYTQSWYENSVSVERGPILYALKIGNEKKKVVAGADSTDYGPYWYEFRPTTPWNYGLIETPANKLADQYTVVKNHNLAAFPWSAEAAPVLLKTKARRIPSWQLYNEMAGPIPFSVGYGLQTGAEEQVTLVPYGCTILRISEFPVVGRR